MHMNIKKILFHSILIIWMFSVIGLYSIIQGPAYYGLLTNHYPLSKINPVIEVVHKKAMTWFYLNYVF